MNRALYSRMQSLLQSWRVFILPPESSATQVAQRMPHYLQLQKAPQLAVMNDQHGFIRQDASQEGTPVSQASERFVF